MSKQTAVDTEKPVLWTKKLFRHPKIGMMATIISVTLLIDQLSKVWARQWLQSAGTQVHFGGLLRFEHSENTGAFLSLFADLPEIYRKLILVVLVLVFLIGLAIFLIRQTNLPTIHVIGYSLLLSGGVGNIIDRIYKGSVTDFLWVGFEQLHTGIFNFADMFILLSIGLILIKARSPT